MDAPLNRRSGFWYTIPVTYNRRDTHDSGITGQEIVMLMPDKIKAIAKSGVVINLANVDKRDRNYLLKQLTLTYRPYKGPKERVKCYVKDGDWLWTPRYFDEDKEYGGECEDSKGKAVSFDFKLTLDPKRGQPRAVEAMFRHLISYKGGILRAFTGCGKTILGYAIAAKFNRAIGVLVYAEHMIDNWIEHAEKCFGIKPEDIGIVKEGRCDLGKDITIMSVQTLYSGRDIPNELFDQVGVIVADECHRYGAPVWQTTLQRFPARYRLGMSADHTRADGLGAIIPWNFGDVAYTIEKTEDIAKPDVNVVNYETTYDESKYRSWPSGKPDISKYRRLVSRDEGRNIMIGKLLVEARQKKRKAIVFSHYRKHLLLLKQAFDRDVTVSTKSALFISKTKQRGEPGNMKDLIATLEQALEADYIFTTYSMASAAFNAPHLDTGFATTPLSKPLQPLGRLRDKGPEDRQPLMWVDITETGVPYACLKVEERILAYKDLGCKVSRFHKKNVPTPKKLRRRTKMGGKTR